MADRIVASLILALLSYLSLYCIFYHGESDNTIAYSLPAANVVERGSLSLPQLGSQFGLDRFWLLNSPLMAGAQVPLFAVFGVRRSVDLLGVAILTAINGLIFFRIVRSAFSFRLLSPPLLLSASIVLNGQVLAELSNQRYLIIGFGLMALAFLPISGMQSRPKPAWQWLAVGALPLAHPGFLPAWAVWLAWEACRLLLSRTPMAAPGSTPIPLPRWGLVAFAMTAGLALAWYGRPEMLREQFIPHLRYGNFRGGKHLIGLWNSQLSPIFAAPSRATGLFFVALAWAFLGACIRPESRRRVGPVILPAVLIALLTVLDLVRGFGYFPFYYLGAGANLLFALRSSRAKRFAAIVLAGLAAASIVSILWLSRGRPQFYDTPSTLAFIIDRTRPGDRIVIGPPFVLAAASRGLPGDRQILRVVPAPYFLDAFDEVVFRDDIARATNVYVGSERWYNKQMGHHIPDTGPKPIFRDADVAKDDFGRLPVIVARRRDRDHGTSTPPADEANPAPGPH